MKPSLVILNIYQLGYHTDTYNYCKYLKSDFEITYISFDQGFEAILIEDVSSISVPQPRGILNLIKGYIKLAKIAKKIKPEIVFLVYVRFISIVKFFLPGTHFIFDVRTGYLFDNNFKRKIWNSLLWLESLAFTNITVISNGLRKDLHLPSRKCQVIPLGGNLKNIDHDFSSLKLIYIGTLDQRNIHATIEGFRLFIMEHPEVEISYDILGYGKREIEDKIKNLITKYNLGKYVIFHGRIPYTHIDDFLLSSNIGVVYIPVTRYYDHQPTTKLFEFLLAGIPVIATKTSENKLIINDSNGILMDESPEGFMEGLRLIGEKLNQYNAEIVRRTVSEFCWDKIVNDRLKPLLMDVLYGRKNI